MHWELGATFLTALTGLVIGILKWRLDSKNSKAQHAVDEKVHVYDELKEGVPALGEIIDRMASENKRLEDMLAPLLEAQRRAEHQINQANLERQAMIKRIYQLETQLRLANARIEELERESAYRSQ